MGRPHENESSRKDNGLTCQFIKVTPLPVHAGQVSNLFEISGASPKMPDAPPGIALNQTG